MVSKGKQKAIHRYGKGARSGKRVPRGIYEGAGRKTIKKKLQCGKCHRWFATLPELNLHYSARDDHKRKKPQPRNIQLRAFKEFTPEQQKQAVAMVNLLGNKREMQHRIKEAMERYRYGKR